MTLKEKFQEWHDAPTNETIAENIIDLEQIADDFAIGFAEWLIKLHYGSQIANTTKELLQTYKKEKGL